MLKGKFSHHECTKCGDAYEELTRPCSSCGEMAAVTTMHEFEAMVSIPFGVESLGEEMEESEFLHLLRKFIASGGDTLVDAKVHKAPRLVEAVLDRLDKLVEEVIQHGRLDSPLSDREVEHFGRVFGKRLTLTETWKEMAPPELTISCICRRAVTLTLRGGQYQHLYQGECSCGRTWNLEDVRVEG